MVYIYKIICPITNVVKYVGQTVRPKRRLNDHCNSKSTLVGIWIQELKLKNEKPKFKIIARVKKNNALKRENFWIKYYYEKSNEILNDTGDISTAPNSLVSLIEELNHKYSIMQLSKMCNMGAYELYTIYIQKPVKTLRIRMTEHKLKSLIK